MTRAETAIHPMAWAQDIPAAPPSYKESRDTVLKFLQENNPLKLPLFDAQKKAVAHMAGMRYSCLFDEMGLGKTVQALTLSEILYNKDLTVIVCPANVKTVWQEEIQKFTHCDERYVWVGAADDYVYFSDSVSSKFRYFIVNYDAIMAAGRRGVMDAPAVLKQAKHVILDEVHNIKNPRSKKFQFFHHHLKQAIPDSLTLLTGTPVDRYAGDIWSYFALLDLSPHVPGYPFLKRFSNFSAWEDYYSERRGKIYGGFRSSTLPDIDYMMGLRCLRRKTKDLYELPKCHRQIIDIPDEAIDLDMDETIAAFKQGIRLLNSDFALPVGKEGKPLSPTAGLGIIQKARVSISNTMVPWACEMGERYLKNLDKIAIYSEFKSSLSMIQANMADRGIETVTVTGDDSKAERDAKLQLFRDNPNKCALLASYGVLAEGTNLQYCKALIKNDIPWRPLTHLQTERRIHRLGQDSETFIVELRCRADSFVLRSIQGKTRFVDIMDKIFDRKQKEIADGNETSLWPYPDYNPGNTAYVMPQEREE